MNNSLKTKKNKCFKLKPIIGFFPFFYSLGDTYPLIEIAKNLKKEGTKVVFFSRGGKYEKMAKNQGFKIIKVNPYYSNISFKIATQVISDKNLSEVVEEEIDIFEKNDIQLLLTNFYYSTNISTKALQIPLIFLISATYTHQYFRANYGTFPDQWESILTRLIPTAVKNRFFNWYKLNKKSQIKEFNRLAKTYNIPVIKHDLDLLRGDYVFICDDKKFLNLQPNIGSSNDYFIGPILPQNFSENKKQQIDYDVYRHLNRPGKSILLSMGSSGNKELFIDILKILKNTNYNVVAIYTTILNKEEIPSLSDNILLKKFVPSIQSINKNVDLAIIHGGRGTVYTTAYSGKPAIGIPMFTEQQFNLDCLIRHGAAIKMSGKFFSEKKLLNNINKIFLNYDYYIKNAQNLSKIINQPNGAKNAVKIILDILNDKKTLLI